MPQRGDNLFTPQGKQVFKEATAIQLQYLCGFMTEQFCACGPETWYYGNVKEMRKILTCVKSLLVLKSENFSVGTRFILPLMVPGLQRRHRQMRREAMELLEEHPMREGLWDSRLLAAIIRWVSGIDGEGLTMRNLCR
jgi:hypothetical protein